MAQRNTFQKSMTLKAVLNLANHPTAEDVYNYVHRQYPQISRTTVYRNLNKLCEGGQLYRVKVFGSADRYDHRTGGHYHFICNECGQLCDLELPYMDQINRMCAGMDGRQINDHQILFDGVCRDCLEKAKNRLKSKR